jgi:glycosyltransferase involved in cell wall biosynthesis
LIIGGEDIEIIIVNDGSTDNTAFIAEEYEKNYQGIVRVIHQENGGHGEAVNTGLREAKGLYFKVVDSDDWVNRESLTDILDVLRFNARGGRIIDMLISNYVYEKEGAKRKRVMRYANSMPEDRVFGWSDLKPLGISHYILMHSLIYRTQLLKDCELVLPAHTFYVDNLVAFVPFPYVKTMYYVNTNFYRYYIGRSDQSVNEEVMISRIDQQIKVNKLMIDCFSSLRKKQPCINKRLYKYMASMLCIVTAVSSALLIRSQSEENINKKKELWEYLKKSDKRIYKSVRHSVLGNVFNLPGRGGRKVSVTAYQIAQRLYGFN